LLGIFFRNSLALADSSSLCLSRLNTVSGLSEDDIEVHSINPCSRVILDPEINMLGYTKSEVSGTGEVSTSKFEFFDLKSLL
jgi:hypothetical protein